MEVVVEVADRKGFIMDKRALLKGLLWDIGLPTAVYYVCRGMGVDALPALIAGGVAALARVGFAAAIRRRFNAVAAVVAAAFALVLAVSALTGDPRILLAREPLVSGALGLVLLGSGLLDRPVMLSLLRRLNSARNERLARWDESGPAGSSFRRAVVVLSVVWGAGLLTEAAVRICLIYLLPLDAAAGTSALLQLGTMALLGSWSLWYRHRRLRAAASIATGAEASRAR